MAEAKELVAALKKQLAEVEADLRARSEDPELVWAQSLRAEYATARERGRTALAWSVWRDGEVALAGVAWVLATVFVRFVEDNRLVDRVWIAGAGDRMSDAVDAETAFYAADPARNSRDWLRDAFAALTEYPATQGLVDPGHNPVWTAPLGADLCDAILGFWRQQDAQGELEWSLADPAWDTRFLGDLYQDLSEFAKKKYALLQTPDFVEEFILDRTLIPALAEVPLAELKMIDPTCGSGHFLLGGFARILDAWLLEAPAMDVRARVQHALDAVNGVDINPFAVAIARFRLTLAALQACVVTRLADAPAFRLRIAVGDSLLVTRGELVRSQGTLDLDDGEDDGPAGFLYAAEDVDDYPDILTARRYHVVVGNPPYITVKDKALNEAYRRGYETCKGKYALSVPFMELFFDLAVRGNGHTAGWVGQITSNSFMKREFGAKLIEDMLSGVDPLNPVDLTDVIDASGAYIPGHGTPTVILIGRRRRPVGDTVHAVLGVRGEPGQPVNPRRGLVWSEIADHVDSPDGFDGNYVTITDLPRDTLAHHPWSLSGGGAGAVKDAIDAAGSESVSQAVDLVGVFGMTNADEAFLAPRAAFGRRGVESALHRRLVVGESIRDFGFGPGDDSLFPYQDGQLLPIADFPGIYMWLWPAKSTTWSRVTFNKTSYRAEGRTWWEWHQVALDRLRTPLSIAFAFVATHNHFVLDRGGKVFNRSAPVIKLPAEATVDDHLGLLGVLNSSTACFW
ncbi:MAG: hypothetical protein QG671_2060, partial [Actinomycetota bacterium]|nr:hypothetical protein [Actinomycetota bacterium]